MMFSIIGGFLVAVIVGGLCAYEYWLRPAVSDHFGETDSWGIDRDSRTRRRTFERHSARAIGGLMVASFLSGVRDLDLPILPDVFTLGAVVFAAISVASALAAVWCWLNPHEP
jgi:hypothetical protein